MNNVDLFLNILKAISQTLGSNTPISQKTYNKIVDTANSAIKDKMKENLNNEKKKSKS